MAILKLRDRDAIITKEGLIFRVFGYTHPPEAYICDAEYAPARIFKSNNPRALRNKGRHVFYKFYEDEGWRFIQESFPHYAILYKPLRKKVVGVNCHNIAKVERPNKKLEKLIKIEVKDELQTALQDVLGLIMRHSELSTRNFGVFGSMLHGFHHPQFSDIDLIIYGRENVAKLRVTLQELYKDKNSPIRNEFNNSKSIEGKCWRFQNYSIKDFLWHQQRKLIYALFNDERRRFIKTEFEPVKGWKEISNENLLETKITQMGWVKMLAYITEDKDTYFIPSIYGIQPIKVLYGIKEAEKSERVISYLEEFRMQGQKDEKIYVEGNLEKVSTSNREFNQIMLTYCSRYYNQVLKVVS